MAQACRTYQFQVGCTLRTNTSSALCCARWLPSAPQKGLAACKALPVDLALIQEAIQHAPLAFERVVYPCSSVNCGDMIYQSTLDPALRMEEDGISPAVAFIGALIMAYITATPGPLQATWDMYIVAPFKSFSEKSLRKKDVQMGKKLAQGGFGTVYMGTSGATIPGKIRKGQAIIIKKVTEFGEAEVWMNERLARAAPSSCATFLTAYPDGPAKVGTPLVLVWKFEGKTSLFDALQVRTFPENVEESLFGRVLRIEDNSARALASIKVIMQQILENLVAIHQTGIVHRDVKPQNMILSKSGIKMIDLGAAADLRVGINYVPNEYLLDPRYAPPEQYIMSPLTPRAPPTPVAALLSPVLWRINQPDRFDMYSAGIVLMQLAFANLRSDSALIAFRTKLEDCDHDIRKWRQAEEERKNSPFTEGFRLLDSDNGAGWDLICQLLEKVPSARLSAKQALKHRWLAEQTESEAQVLAGQIGRDLDAKLQELIDASSVSKRTKESLSEAELYSALQQEEDEKAPQPARNMPRTIAWWQERAKRQDEDSIVAKVLQWDLPKNLRMQRRPAGGFATQRAMGIPVPDDKSKPASSRDKTDDKGDADQEAQQPRRNTKPGILSLLSRD